LLTHGKKYTYADLLTIAKGQVDLEDKYIATSNLRSPIPNSAPVHSPLFIDTDMYVMKVWCEFVYGKSHPFILDQIAQRKYDLYFLCNLDLPWIPDDLREYPDLVTREKLYVIYKQIMMNQSVPCVEIRGDSEQRFKIAVESVDRLLQE
jgi:nicotinamide riboside kinase